MQLRRLEREYQEVLKHEIKEKDPKFKGLKNVLQEMEMEENKTNYKLEDDIRKAESSSEDSA